MNDFERAAKNIGNRFNLVLVASERVREIHRERMKQAEEGLLDFSKRQTVPAEQAISEIEDGTIGKEYLKKVKVRNKRKRPKFDEI